MTIGPAPAPTLTLAEMDALFKAGAMPTALTVMLPAHLVTDLCAHYQREEAQHAAFCFKHFTFDEWITERLKDAIYGKGEPPEATW